MTNRERAEIITMAIEARDSEWLVPLIVEHLNEAEARGRAGGIVEWNEKCYQTGYDAGRAAGIEEAAKYIDDYSTGMGDEIRQLVTLGSVSEKKVPDIAKSECKKCGHTLGRCSCEWRA